MPYHLARAAAKPDANFATHDQRGDANGLFDVLDFDAATEESAVFNGVLQDYGGGGLTITLFWTAQTATSGDVKWSAAIENGLTDIDLASFATAKTVTSTTNGTSGIKTASVITCSDGAEVDSLPTGAAEYRIKIVRVAADVADTMAGDAELSAVLVVES